MATVHLRKQGGAAIITIPADIVKALRLSIGSELDVAVVDGALTARPRRTTRRTRYKLQELLTGATPAVMRRLSEDTEWARDGDAVGREI